MSLITQCPACSTMFKVVPDQLRVSQGWVRCGQCDEVFDANAHMRNLDQEPSPKPKAEPKPNPAATAAEPSANRSASSKQVPEQIPPQASGSYDWAGVVGGDEVNPISEPLNDAFLEKSPQELAEASHVNAHVETVAGSDAHLSVYPLSGAAKADPTDKPIAPPNDSATLSFMASKRSGPLQTKRGRALWIAAFVLLSGVMFLQVVLHERDRLAAAKPELKPALVDLCEAMNCKVHALRQIESIVIDSSTFSKVQADVYKLSVTLKNTAAVEIAKPFLELTLTDAQDQALIRKVISPVDFGDKEAVIAKTEEVSWTIPITVKHLRATEQIAGYRVLAFYP